MRGDILQRAGFRPKSGESDRLDAPYGSLSVESPCDCTNLVCRHTMTDEAARRIEREGVRGFYLYAGRIGYVGLPLLPKSGFLLEGEIIAMGQEPIAPLHLRTVAEFSDVSFLMDPVVHRHQCAGRY